MNFNARRNPNNRLQKESGLRKERKEINLSLIS